MREVGVGDVCAVVGSLSQCRWACVGPRLWCGDTGISHISTPPRPVLGNGEFRSIEDSSRSHLQRRAGCRAPPWGYLQRRRAAGCCAPRWGYLQRRRAAGCCAPRWGALAPRGGRHQRRRAAGCCARWGAPPWGRLRRCCVAGCCSPPPGLPSPRPPPGPSPAPPCCLRTRS